MQNGFTLEQAFGELPWIGEVPPVYARAFYICFTEAKGYTFNWNTNKFVSNN